MGKFKVGDTVVLKHKPSRSYGGFETCIGTITKLVSNLYRVEYYSPRENIVLVDTFTEQRLMDQREYIQDKKLFASLAYLPADRTAIWLGRVFHALYGKLEFHYVSDNVRFFLLLDAADVYVYAMGEKIGKLSNWIFYPSDNSAIPLEYLSPMGEVFAVLKTRYTNELEWLEGNDIWH